MKQERMNKTEFSTVDCRSTKARGTFIINHFEVLLSDKKKKFKKKNELSWLTYTINIFLFFLNCMI